MFKALDYVNYDQLQVNARKTSDVGQERLPTNLLRSASLQELCCDAINDSADISLGCQDILVSAVKVLPQHLLPMLLRVAIDNHQCTAVSTIISCWPHHTLRWADMWAGKSVWVCTHVCVCSWMHAYTRICLCGSILSYMSHHKWIDVYMNRCIKCVSVCVHNFEAFLYGYSHV